MVLQPSFSRELELNMNLDNFFLVDHSENQRFQKLLKKTFKDSEHFKESELSKESLWPAKYYGLDNVHHYNDLNSERQNKVLKQLEQGLLGEAYFIEMAGMSFAAKMVESSENVEERVFYSIMGSEEAKHFRSLLPFLGNTPKKVNHPFVMLIGDIIVNSNRPSAILLIQVLLEGWGIFHYTRLQKHCCHPNLKQILLGIIQDEARHHGCGILLNEKQELTVTELEYLKDKIGKLLNLVRIGPAHVMNVLHAEEPFENSFQKQESLIELNAEADTQMKLDEIRGLLKKALPQQLIFDLSKDGLFTAHKIQKMSEFC